MSIKLKKQASGSIVRPPASHLAFFVDQNGVPSVMDSEGVVSPAVTVDGSPLSLNEQGEAPDPEADKVKLYAKDVAGVSQPFFITDDGTEVQIGAAQPPTIQTFYDNSQSAELNQTIAPSGTYSWNTGIVLDFPTNGTFLMHLETRSIMAESSFRDLAYVRFFFAWATPPTVPGSISANVFSQQDVPSGEATVLDFCLDDITVNASNELVIEFISGKSDDAQLILKATVSPVTELPFSPIAPVPP